MRHTTILGTFAMSHARIASKAAATEALLAMREMVNADGDPWRAVKASELMILHGAACLMWEPVTALSWFFQWAIEEAAQ